MLVVESSCKTRRSGKVKIMDDRARSDPRGERSWMDLAPMRSVAGRGTSEKKNGGEEGGRKEGVRERNRASPLGGCHLPRLEESRKIRGKNQAAANRHATRVQRFFFKVSFPPYRLDNSGGKGTANVLEFSKLVTQLLVSGLFLHAI